MSKSKFKCLASVAAALLLGATLCACSKAKPAVASDDEYAPVSSVAMTQTDAAALAGKMHVRVYYANSAGTKLVAETQFLDYSRKLRKTDALAKEILTKMLENPQNSNLQKTLPDGSLIQAVVLAGDLATVDLNPAFYESLPSDEKLASLVLASIVTTLTELKEVTYVTFVCDGQAPTAANRSLNFTRLTRSTALVTASAQIATLAEIDTDAQEAATALEEEPALE